MLVEERIYRMQIGRIPEFFRIYEEHGLAVQTKILGNMVGYFYTEIGDLNHIIHMWGYKSLDDRAKRRARLAKSKQWHVFLKAAAGIVLTQQNRILIPAPFSPIK